MITQLKGLSEKLTMPYVPIEKLVEMASEGKTAREIADHLGVTYESVRKRARRRGIKLASGHDIPREYSTTPLPPKKNPKTSARSFAEIAAKENARAANEWL